MPDCTQYNEAHRECQDTIKVLEADLVEADRRRTLTVRSARKALDEQDDMISGLQELNHEYLNRISSLENNLKSLEARLKAANSTLDFYDREEWRHKERQDTIDNQASKMVSLQRQVDKFHKRNYIALKALKGEMDDCDPA